MLGSILYTVFGLKPVLYAIVVCFFLTAIFECFIKLDYQAWDCHSGVFSIIKEDFLQSMRFILEEESDIVKMLGFTAVSRLLVEKIKSNKLSYILSAIGVCIVPAGIAFLSPSDSFTVYF